MKRITFFVATALILGGFSALPAHATGSPVNLIASATSITTAGTTATQIAGPANFVTVSNTVVVGPGAKSVYFTVAGGVTSTATTTGTIAAGGSVNIQTSTPGTITVSGYAITGGAAALSPTDTIVITVVGSLPGTLYASSTILAAPSTALPTPTTDATFSVTQPAGAVNVANFTVSELDAAGIPMLAANAKVITVLVQNGLISSPNLFAAPSANTSYMTGTPINATTDFVLSGIPGLGGTSTVTISVNGVVLKTYSVKFTGVAARIVLTPINSVVGIGAATAILPNAFNPIGITANVNALEVQEFDATGNLIAINPANISVTSTAPSIATTGGLDSVANYPLGNIVGGTPTSTSAVGVSINGVSAGNTTFVATDNALGLTSAAVPIRVSSGVPTSVVITTNLPDYAAGASGTMSTTLLDAAGPLPAGTYVALAGQAISSIALAVGSNLLPGVPTAVVGPPVQKVGQVTINNKGAYTFNFNAPLVAGNITINATPATSSIVVTPGTFTVGGGITGPAVADPASLTEATNATTAASDLTVLTGALADKADQAAATVGATATTVQGVINTLATTVTAVLAKSAVLTAAMAKIAKLLKK